MVDNRTIDSKFLIPELRRQLARDVSIVTQELGALIDDNIAQKFAEGFPDNELQPETVKRKKSNKVGVETGALFRAATAFTNFKIFTHTTGTVGPILKKSRRGLTKYSQFVKTKIGGEVDYLAISNRDKVRIGRIVGRAFRRRQYKSNNLIRVIRKPAKNGN